MKELDELKIMMNEIICQIVKDEETGITRFLQANPYSSFEYYNFSVLKDKPNLFENSLYLESEQSLLYKEQIIDILENPNGKNTFFLVGYQGCGKSTFIHSVINKYCKETNARVVLIDCDKVGKDTDQIHKSLCRILKNYIKKTSDIINFLDFYATNRELIEELNYDNFDRLYTSLYTLNENRYRDAPNCSFDSIKKFLNMLSNKELFYLLVIWNLSSNFNNPNNDEKLMIFIDNLDCIDEYYELSNFISCIDALTVDFSDMFEKFKLSKIPNKTDTFVSKIKIFVAMRETTKANLPQSHFSDAFKSIYTNKDMTEWYDKGEIIKNRVSTLFKYDENNKLKDKQREQLKLVINISDDIYTKKVLYPLFNNNYRSAVDMLVEIVINNTQQMTKYSQLMAYDQPIYKHGARGILFKSIFDEFNKGDGNEESCFRQIGVLDLLNRKNNSVSICRLILSYLSNYTETKCDSGRNSIALSEIINDFTNVFSTNEVMKTLCAMFSLRDSKWSHLISFNQIDYKKDKNQIKGLIDLKDLNSDKTMVHYSCAGKIYIEYITTHFEFFNARIFKEQKEALFCDSNLAIDPVTKNYICCDIIDKIYTEVERCCLELKNFNIKLCNNNNYLNPYCNPAIYLDTHYICMFKRVDNDGKERRFKQFHEERIILTHINYIDCYRLYVLNNCNIISDDEKIKLNEKLTERIKKYVDLLDSDKVLKGANTTIDFVEHYKNQIEVLSKDWENFTIAISKNI